MATKRDIDDTYGYLDELWRLSLGDGADITCPLYEHDYSKTLDQAQAEKHRYILDQLNVRPGSRVMDIGCGWGGLLSEVRRAGGIGVGLTLASCQHAFCRRSGLDVRLEDWKAADPRNLGRFDAVASVGAFEHFCSEEEWKRGEQLDIYRRFFQFSRDLLSAGDRLYLQTMIWGKNRPPLESMRLDSPRGSDGYVLACLRMFYPGSWLPESLSQIREAASGLFRFCSSKNGREDYAYTMKLWGTRLRRPTLRKVAATARLWRYPLRDPAFFRKIETLWFDYNAEVFQRCLFDHERIVFEAV